MRVGALTLAGITGMSFWVMDPDITKGIKHLDADGNETLEDDDPYVFIRYEASAALPGGKRSRTQLGHDGAA